MTKSNKNLIVVLILVLIFIGGAFIFNHKKQVDVGCANCPVENPNAALIKDWSTFTDTAQGVSFQYPEKVSTNYISSVAWPPKVALFNKPYSCAPTGNENSTPGITGEMTINNHTYCVTKQSEGAAGSTYTTYTYAFEKDNKLVNMTFTLRFVQCANYDEPNKTTCSSERASFNIDNIVDLMAQSLSLK